MQRILRLLTFLAIFAVLATSLAAAAATPQDVVVTLGKGYEALTDLQADFSQRTAIASLNREERGSGELFIKKGANKLGIKVLPYPLAVLSQPYDDRAPCHYCGACNYGCDTRSRFSSLEVLVPKLQTRKNFTLRSNAAVHTVLMDSKSGRARGVTYIDTQNRQEYEAFGKVVVLGASLVETIRILFNSKNREFPNGLGNSSGVLGRYLTEHVAFNGIDGFFPQLAGRPATNDDGPGESCLYIPRYNYGHKDKKKFLRGYRFNFSTGCGTRSIVALMAGACGEIAES
jgi:choline dehydrogenase-like flavoprotein